MEPFFFHQQSCSICKIGISAVGYRCSINPYSYIASGVRIFSYVLLPKNHMCPYRFVL